MWLLKAIVNFQTPPTYQTHPKVDTVGLKRVYRIIHYSKETDTLVEELIIKRLNVKADTRR